MGNTFDMGNMIHSVISSKVNHEDDSVSENDSFSLEINKIRQDRVLNRNSNFYSLVKNRVVLNKQSQLRTKRSFLDVDFSEIKTFRQNYNQTTKNLPSLDSENLKSFDESDKEKPNIFSVKNDSKINENV